jgi:trigger factor
LKLQVAIADLSQCRKDLTIEIAADEVKAEFDKAYETLLRSTNLPGFRPGRLPREAVRQRFGKEIKDAVARSLLPHALEHAATDHQLRIVGQAQVDEISINEDEPLKFKARVEVLPEFELHEYKGLKATKRVQPVTDEEIERALEYLRHSAAGFVPIEDRPSQDGDFIRVNLVGKYVEPRGEEDLKVDNEMFELGSTVTQPEFNENLRGVVAGDVRKFRVKYHEYFAPQNLAGKTLDFTATVVATLRKELPKLDDDFARDFGACENLRRLREKIRENLAMVAEKNAEERLRQKLLRRMMKDYDFDVPSSLLERRAAERAQEWVYSMWQSGASPQMIEANWDAQLREAGAQALFDVRSALVLARIGEAEKIEVAEREIEREIERMAAMNNETAEQLKARLTKDGSLSSIETTLRYRKALDVVVNRAEITTERITENQDAEQPQSEIARI